MKHTMLLLSLLTLTACGKSETSGQTAAGATAKPVFSVWTMNDGFTHFDLRGLAFGRVQVEPRLTIGGYSYNCRMVIDTTGDEQSGTVVVVSAQPLNDSGFYSECQGRVGTYRYVRNVGLLITVPGRPDALQYY